MPGELTGAHVVSSLRADYPMIPMFLVTAHIFAVTAKFLDQHRIGLVGKPYDTHRLTKMLTLAIAGVLDWRGHRRLTRQP